MAGNISAISAFISSKNDIFRSVLYILSFLLSQILSPTLSRSTSHRSILLLSFRFVHSHLTFSYPSSLLVSRSVSHCISSLVVYFDGFFSLLYMDPVRIKIGHGSLNPGLMISVDENNRVSQLYLQQLIKGLVTLRYRDPDSNFLCW